MRGLHTGSGEAPDIRLSILNPSPSALPGPCLVHHLVPTASSNDDGWAIDSLAADGSRCKLSYAELHASSDALAARVSRALATSPAARRGGQHIVPLMIPQGPDLYIAILATLKAGLAFCPLHVDAPAERAKFILGDVKAALVLTISPLVHTIPQDGSRIQVLPVDVPDRSDGEFAAMRHREPIGDDLAYVMYTSGSTGVPKGVGVSHGAATQSILAHDRHVPTFSRFLQFAAPTFDVSVFEIFFPLFRGRTLVCCNRADMLTDLPGVIQMTDVDACELTPSVAGSLLKLRSNAPKLHLLLTIGEMLTQPVIDEFGGDPAEDSMLWGMYGPTEAAIHCTLQPSFGKGTAPGCIGYPLDTVSAFVIALESDDSAPHRFEPVPMGETGELAVGGLQLASGYINRPEQTARAFINTPFGRVYRTGDRARIRPDGSIECLGRVVEGQVKLNGQRMELGEVEHALLRVKGCHSAFCCVLSNMLIAFAAVDSSDQIQEDILTSCKSWLPAFMIPSEVVTMDSFPRLPSGKTDREKLKNDYMKSRDAAAEITVTHKDDLDRRLYDTVRDILGVDVAPNTPLHMSGLDSLAAIELASRLRLSGCAVSTMDILEHGSLAELQKCVRGRSGMDTAVQLPALLPPSLMSLVQQDTIHGSLAHEAEFAFGCTPLQTSMMVESLKDPRLYVSVVHIQFPESESPALLESCFRQVAEQNEILRSGFLQLESGLVQVVWRQLSDDQVVVVDSFTEVDRKVDMNHFLMRPLRVEIITASANEQASARIVMHHALFDGWTVDILLDDLSQLCHGKEIARRPQFRDVVQAISMPSSADVKMTASEFWAQQLRGITSSSLPNFRSTAVPHPQVLTTSRRLGIDRETVNKVCSQSGVSHQAIFQAALAWLWGALLATKDVIIGAVISGRTLPVPGIERVMGPCISTLPLRVNVGECRTIAELVKIIHALHRESLRYGLLPLADIKKAAGLPPAGKLFDLLFVYQESLPSRRRAANTARKVLHLDAVETKLVVEVEPCDTAFTSSWTWHSDAFSREDVGMLAKHLDHLVGYFAAHFQGQMTTIAGSFPSELSSTYTSGLRGVETCSSLSALIEKTVRDHPDGKALCFAHSIGHGERQHEQMTYAELNHTANQIARHLIANGVGAGRLVAIVMNKSPRLYAAILGVLKTGCAYLPILPSTPRKRIRMICEQAQPQATIVDHVAQWEPATFGPGAVTDVTDRSINKYAGTDVITVGQDSSQPAYVIYTSGTTGRPKGVSVTNKNMLSNIAVLSRIYGHDRSCRMLQACSQAFDVSVFEIMFAWANGMTLCAAANETLFEDMESAIRELGVTHLSMTVTVASLLHPDNVPDVRFLVTSGEPMTDKVLDRWAEHLYQGYGPSETTNICTVRKVGRGDSSQYLGWALENTSSLVLEPETDTILPRGCVGELVFGGEQVAAGYLKLPDLTAAKFFQHPQYGRLYRSGDVGRMLSDGSLIILGRLDSQIKLRGQRIELGEMVSLVLGSGEAMAATGLLLTMETTGSQQLALFYVPTNQSTHAFSLLPMSSSARQAHQGVAQLLQSWLPLYMVPSFLFPISILPMTSSGKTDSGRLRDAAQSLSDEALDQYSLTATVLEDSTAEWSEAERHVAEALAETVQADSRTIGRWTSFAALGLDSVSTLPLARRLQQRVQKRVPMSVILQNPTVSRLARALAMDAAPSCTGGERAAMVPRALVDQIRERFISQCKAVESVLPCTAMQAAMLASSASEAQVPYCNQVLFRLRRPAQEIKRHWDEMRRRHGVLRTCFVASEHVHHPFIQVVLEAAAFSWQDMESEQVEQGAAEHLRSLPEAVDSLQPPISLAMIRAGEARYLSLVCHHALHDAVAMATLTAEVETLARGGPLSTPPSFERFLQQSLALPRETDEFWTGHLRDFRPRQLARHDSAMVLDSSAVQVVELVQRPLASIETRVGELDLPLLAVCQAAWAESLAALLGVSDVCFGHVVSGRSMLLGKMDDAGSLDDLEKLENLVAPCFNTLPMRLKLPDSASHRDVAKQCQSVAAAMLPFQFTPLRRIQSLCRVHNGQLFDSLLLVQRPARRLDEQVPVILEVIPCTREDRLKLVVHARVPLMPETRARLLLDLFVHAFNLCLQYPSSRADIATELPESVAVQLRSKTAALPEAAEAAAGTEPEAERLCRDAIRASSSGQRWSRLELLVRAILAKLSGRPQDMISREMSMHRLGLDSISAVQVAYLLRQEGFSLSVGLVLESGSCAAIAARLQSVKKKGPVQKLSYDVAAFKTAVAPDLAAAALPWQPVAVLPCTAMQQGMLSQFILSEGTSYFNCVSWRVQGSVDLAALALAWRSVVAKQQILRTGFASVTHPDSTFAMVVYAEADARMPIERLCRAEAETFRLERWRRECASQSLRHLARPPWQVLLADGEVKQMHLAMHHALYDAFSMQQLMQHLGVALQGKPLGPSSEMASSLSTLFSHLSETKAEAERFWRSKAADLVVNAFPTMTPLRVEAGQVLQVSRECRPSAPARRQKAARAGITMQAALQSAWCRLLAAYVGEPRVTFGVVLCGRSSDEAGAAAMPMITTLPVLVRDQDDNRALMQAMMEYNSTTRSYEHRPLPDIQRWLGCPDGPLFDTILLHQQSAQARQQEPAPWRVVHEVATVEYPVSLEAQETGSGTLQLNLVFHAHVLPPEQGELLLRQFELTLDHLLDHPDGQAEHLAATCPDLFSVLPARHSQLPTTVASLHGFVEQSARLHPDRLALEFVDDLAGHSSRRWWTYRELDQYGCRVAHLLQRSGIQPGGIVAVSFDKCPEAYFSILGIMKAGCCFLALDPGAPCRRRELILQDSGAVALLLRSGHGAALGFEPRATVFEIEHSRLAAYPSSGPDLWPPISAHDSCYCLYTSGTSGTPKGCLISHESAVQAMLAFQALFKGRWDDKSRWLQFASFHFDVSVLEMYWSWSVGIAVVSADRDVILTDLAGAISKLDITHIDLTPSLARLLQPEEVPSLCRGLFITGGEQLRQDVLNSWGGKQVIHNAYGPTEATIGVTMYCAVPSNGRPSNIGKAFPNVGAYVLKVGTERAVLRGAVGELCVSGRLVGKGYLNRPELSSERFPTLPGPGERVYRTGDLVRLLHDGCFDFLGRADDQVKLRGQRLETAEIDHVIRAGLGDVADVATLLTKVRGQQDRAVLVSFVVSTAAKADKVKQEQELALLLGPAELHLCRRAQAACLARLPGYMVPSYVMAVPGIPLSANNKVLKSVLAGLLDQLTPAELGRWRQQDAPLAETEPLLARVLADMSHLHESEIGSWCTLADLGIDSVSVIGLARRLRAAGFSNVSPSAMLRHGCVDGLGRVLRSKPAPGQVARHRQAIRACFHRNLSLARRTLAMAAVEYLAPCTPLQEGMLSRSRAKASAYFNTFLLQLAPTVHLGRLRKAWEEVFGMFAVLRTSFLQTPDGYVQVAPKTAVLPWCDFRLQHGRALRSFLRQRYEAWVGANEQSFSRLLELDCIRHDGRHTLVLRIFHALYDATSLRLVLRHVMAKYSDTAMPPGPTFIQVLPHGPLCDSAPAPARLFWEAVLADFTFQPVPPLAPPSAKDVSVVRVMDMVGLERRRLGLAVSHQSMVQAGWLAVLRTRCSFWPAIGLVLSGRSLLLDGVEATVGPLFNTVPFRPRPDSVSSWASLVRETHEFNAAVLAFAHTPLRQVQKWFTRGQAVFDTVFAFDREDRHHRPGGELDDNAMWTLLASEAKSDYPIALEAVLSTDAKLTVTLVAQAHMADDAAAQALLTDLEAAMAAIVSDDNTLFPVGDAGPANSAGHGSAALPSSALLTGTTSQPEFEWTAPAREMQHEMAILAGVPDDLVSADTTLFELGLDSIDVVKLVTRLRRVGIKLKTSELPTIRAAMATHASTEGIVDQVSAQSQQLETSVSALRRSLTDHGHDLDGVEAVLPPTPLQDSMVAEMALSGFRRYFNHDVLELRADIDVELLRSALHHVVANSPILRTTFVPVDDAAIDTAYCQVVNRTIELFNPDVRLGEDDSFDAILEQARRRAETAKASAHLVQVTMVSRGRRYVVLSIAHALYDGASLHLFHQDVQAAYRGRCGPRPDYRPALASIVAADSTGAAARFWADFLHEARPSLLSSTEEEDGGSQAPARRLEATSVLGGSEVRAFCSRLRIRPQVLGQACWAVVLASRVRSLDVVFGVVLSGRDAATQPLLFPTMNTVPVRAVLHGSAADFLAYVGANLSGVAEAMHFPLRRARSLGRTDAALFNTLFTLQTGGQEEQASDTKVWQSVQSASEVEFPVCVEMEFCAAGELVWRVAVDDRYVPDGGPCALVHQLDQVLGRFVKAEDSELLSLMDDGRVSVCGLPAFELESEPVMAQSVVNPQPPGLPGPVTDRDGKLTETEAIVVHVLSQLSGAVSGTTTADLSIYQLGIDSISAIKASSMLRKRGVLLSVRDMVKASSIRHMAAKAHRQETAATRTSDGQASASSVVTWSDHVLGDMHVPALLASVKVEAAEVERVLPASALQVHLLTLWRRTNGRAFFPDFSYELRGGPVLTPDKVDRAWDGLVAEMPILRTRFVATGSSHIPFLQIVTTRPRPAPPLPPDGETRCGQGSEQWHFRRSSSPYVRLEMHNKTTTGAVQLKLKIHHALYDAFSLPMMLDRFKGLLLREHGGPAAAPSYKPNHHLLWTAILNDNYSRYQRKARRTFWTAYLDAIHPPAAVTAARRVCPQTRPTAYLRPAALPDTSMLKAKAAKHGVTLQALFLAAYARHLAGTSSGCASAKTDVVFGVYLANRADEEPVPTLGIVPLRVRLRTSSEDEDEHLLAVAERVHRDLADMSTVDGATAVGLWEVELWTAARLTVDSFVNFLALPSRDEDSAAGSGAVLVPTEMPVGVMADADYDLARSDGSWAERSCVDDAYVDAVDVEAAVRGDALDVGVFCSANLLTEQGASALVDDVVAILTKDEISRA